MSRISISLAVLSLAGAGIFAGCGLLTDDDAPINFYESGVITFSRYEYPHHSLIGLDLASREETVLADTLGWDVAWAPDGERIAFTAYLWDSPIGGPTVDDVGPEVFEMDLLTKEWRIVSPVIDRPWGPGSTGPYYNPVWSPDGNRIAYTRCGGHGGPCHIRIAASDGANGYTEEIVIPADYVPTSHLLDWSPDGGSILLESDPDGSFPYHKNVYQVELSTLDRELVLAADSTFIIRGARYSPRGDRIAFIAYTNGKTEIYTAGVDGSNVRPLTDNSLTERSLAWSPDGKVLSFSASDSGEDERQSHIYIMETRLGAPAERVTTTEASYYDHEWRPVPRR